jgi:hypothetical protein
MHVFNQIQPDRSNSVASLAFIFHSHTVLGLVHVRNDPIRHQLNIPIPIFAILPPALLLVSPLTMNKQDSKVHYEEVREDHAPTPRLTGDGILLVSVREENCVGGRSIDRMRSCVANDVAGHGGRKNIRPGHKPVTKIVDMARGAPPAGNEQFRARSCFNVLQVLDAGVVGVSAKAILLVVDGAEDVVAERLNCEDRDETFHTELNGVGG